MTVTQGRRADDHDSFWADPPGVWWHWPRVDVGGRTEERWLVRPPCGHHFMLAWPQPGHPHHEIEAHDDGAITVEPRPGHSNSILCPDCGWHGYIDHGAWREA